ncbi:hypothetical protein KEM48_005499 [Puccinia striiformis f. sp. tritici PST-130]|nr:hypothetical protein KEM48_005499 [Puccinia striiformis f. sp. tritici PST-130]
MASTYWPLSLGAAPGSTTIMFWFLSQELHPCLLTGLRAGGAAPLDGQHILAIELGYSSQLNDQNLLVVEPVKQPPQGPVHTGHQAWVHPVEGVIPVEGSMANVATTAELYAERTAQCCTNKNKNAPEEWCIHAKRLKC